MSVKTLTEATNERIISMFVANNLPAHKDLWGNERLLMKRTKSGMLLYYRIRGQDVKMAFMDKDGKAMHVKKTPKNIRMAEIQNALVGAAHARSIAVEDLDGTRHASSEQDDILESEFRKSLNDESTSESDHQRHVDAAEGGDDCCAQCGKKFSVDSAGVACHMGTGPDGIDHDADADHVPYGEAQEGELDPGDEKKYPDQYLHIREESSGEEDIVPLSDDTPLDLEVLVRKWVHDMSSGELELDGKVSRHVGEYYATIKTDGEPPNSAVCWDSGGFSVKKSKGQENG